VSALFLPAALAAYVAGIWSGGMASLSRSEGSRRWAGLTTAAAWVLHAGAIVRAGLVAERLPLGNVAEYLLVFGWLVITLHLFVWFRLKVYGAGLVLPPLAAFAAFAAWALLPIVEVPVPVSRPGLLMFHAGAATIGMATLCVAFAMSVLYLIQDRTLKKRKRLGLMRRLPTLEACDRIGLYALLSGFVLLTVGIGTGVGVHTTIYHEGGGIGAKEIFPVLAWLVLAITLAGRTFLGYRGTRSAYLTITGFTLGLLTVLGMTL
jgi:ABC-type uncharacterized transport system permease subunit